MYNQIQPIMDPRNIRVQTNHLPPLNNINLKWSFLNNLVGEVAVLIANKIAAGTSTNARIYLFNRCFANNLANNDFLTIIATALDLLGFIVVNYNRQPIQQQDVDTATNNAIIAYLSYLIINDPNLRGFVNQEEMMSAQRTYQEHANIQSQILQLAQQFQQRQNQPYNGGFNQPNSFNQQPGFVNNNNGFFSSSQSPNGPLLTGVSNRDFGGSMQTDQISNNNQNNSFVNINAQPNQNAQFTRSFNEQPLVNIEVQTKELVWKPTKYQPAPLGYDSRIQRKQLVEKTFGDERVVIEEVIKLTNEEIVMEREKHRLGHSTAQIAAMTVNEQAKAPEPTDTSAGVFRVEDIQNAEDNRLNQVLINAGLDKDPHENLDEGDVMWKDVGFIDDAIYSVRTHHIQLQDSANKMLRERFLIPKVFLCKDPIIDIVQDIIQDKDLLTAANKLKYYINSDRTTDEQKHFIVQFDKYMTLLLNNFLQGQLCTGIECDTFTDDVKQLIEGYIEKAYGPLVIQKFLENQSKIFDDFLKISEDEFFIATVIDRFEPVKEKCDKINYVVFEQNYSITAVNLSSLDLGSLNTKSNLGQLVDSMLPAVNEYSKKLFSTKLTKSNNWAGHLLLTADGEVIIISESPIMPGSYLIKSIDYRHFLP